MSSSLSALRQNPDDQRFRLCGLRGGGRSLARHQQQRTDRHGKDGNGDEKSEKLLVKCRHG
jgi:hypothetical protein